MTTKEMLIKANGTNDMYICGNLYYSEIKGFISDSGELWEGKAFKTLNEFLILGGWRKVIKTTLKELEKELDCKIILEQE